MAATIKTTLKKDRDTKGTFVFKNAEADAPIPSLYIKKGAFGKDGAPEEIEITIKG